MTLVLGSSSDDTAARLAALSQERDAIDKKLAPFSTGTIRFSDVTAASFRAAAAGLTPEQAISSLVRCHLRSQGVAPDAATGEQIRAARKFALDSVPVDVKEAYCLGFETEVVTDNDGFTREIPKRITA